MSDDPILVRRARYARLAGWGRRAGYGCLAVAIASFVVAVAAGFPGPSATIVIAGLAGATLLLPPAIVTGYAVKAAEREERVQPPRPSPPAQG